MPEKVFTADAYVKWLKERSAAKDAYWYGVIFQQASESLLTNKKRQYPDHYEQYRIPRYSSDIAQGKFCGDCVNAAIKGAIWTELGTRKYVYKSHDCPDTNADGMYTLCSKTYNMPHGDISTLPERPGVMLHAPGHVGVYIGSGLAVEWRGFNYGCVTTEVKRRSWKEWTELPWVDYESKNNQADGREDVTNDYTTATTTGNVYMRTGDSTEYNALLAIPKGARVRILDEKWIPVEYNGKIGFCSSLYIRKDE